MSNDTKWIIGTVVVLVGLLSAQIAGVNARVDDLCGRPERPDRDASSRPTRQLDIEATELPFALGYWTLAGHVELVSARIRRRRMKG